MIIFCFGNNLALNLNQLVKIYKNIPTFRRYIFDYRRLMDDPITIIAYKSVPIFRLIVLLRDLF